MSKKTDSEDLHRKVWRHNSFFGFSRLAESNMETIIHSPTTTAAAKEIARRISNECKQLTRALKERVDQ
jgi:hypothetical protein